MRFCVVEPEYLARRSPDHLLTTFEDASRATLEHQLISLEEGSRRAMIFMRRDRFARRKARDNDPPELDTIHATHEVQHDVADR